MNNGFSFNDKHCSEFGVAMRSKNRVLLPRLQPNQIKIPGQHGLYDFGNCKYENRLVEIDCFIQCSSIEDLRIKARAIAFWLSEKAKLVFDDESDKHYYGRLYEQINFENVLRTGFFSLVFELDPFAYGEEITISKTMTEADSVEIDYIGTASTCTRITINNKGLNTINGFTLTYGRLNDGSN